MDADEYQALTAKTEIYNSAAAGFIMKIVDDMNDPEVSIQDVATTQYNWLRLAYCTGKLNGEAGEIAELVFKALRDGTGNPGEIDDERRTLLFKELGDVAWYLARLSDLLGFKLSEVFESNIAKLMDRKERGVLSGSGNER